MTLSTLVALAAAIVPSAFSQSTEWPSALFPPPSNFRSYGTEYACDYVITMQRPRSDSSHTFYFEAQYPTAPPRIVTYVQSNLFWIPTNSYNRNDGIFAIDEETWQPKYNLYGACSNMDTRGYEGEEPIAFRILSDAPWASETFPVEAIVPPPAPPFYEITATPLDDGSVRFTWPEVAEATRYFIVVEGWIFTDRDRLQWATYINEAGNTTLTVPGSFRCRQGAIVAESEPGIYSRDTSPSDQVGF